MGYIENLYKGAVSGDKSSFKELEYNAGAGDAEAQFYLAQYYADKKGGKNSNYEYWVKKAADNGYVSAKQILDDSVEKETVESTASQGEDGNKNLEGFLWIAGGLLLTVVTGGTYIFYGAVVYGLYLIFARPLFNK